MPMSQLPKIKAKKDGNIDVRQRITEAALILFATKGYSGTSIRDITSLAKCNVAAINYHFKNKDNLYVSVFAGELLRLKDFRVNGLNAMMAEKSDSATLKDLIYHFSHLFLDPIINQSSGKYLTKLWLREMLDNHLPDGMIIDSMIKPTTDVFLKAVATIAPKIHQRHTLLCFHSLVAQLIHVFEHMDLFDEVHTGNTYNPLANLHDIINHIVDFSVAGFQCLDQKAQ